MWQQICLTNTDNIKDLLQHYIQNLQDIYQILDQKEALSLYQFFEEARVYRDSFNSTSRGSIMPSYTINIEIADRTGALAEVTALLAKHDLSIKNMNIIHNREAEFGALTVEFYSRQDMLKAIEILDEEAFTTYLKKS